MSNNTNTNNTNYITDVNDADVLFGRGSDVRAHPGNVRYRELLSARVHEYYAVKRNLKNGIVQEIVDYILTIEQGLFLKKIEAGTTEDKVTATPNNANTAGGVWVIADDHLVLEKTKQALRDCWNRLQQNNKEGEQEQQANSSSSSNTEEDEGEETEIEEEEEEDNEEDNNNGTARTKQQSANYFASRNLKRQPEVDNSSFMPQKKAAKIGDDHTIHSHTKKRPHKVPTNAKLDADPTSRYKALRVDILTERRWRNETRQQHGLDDSVQEQDYPLPDTLLERPVEHENTLLELELEDIRLQNKSLRESLRQERLRIVQQLSSSDASKKKQRQPEGHQLDSPCSI